jgi:hypothetical protein
MSLSACHVILSECCDGERLAYDEYLLDDDIEVLDLRLDLLHDYTLLRLRAVHPLPAAGFDFVRVYLSGLLSVSPLVYCGVPQETYGGYEA